MVPEEIQRYLTGRGIHPEVIDRCNLGWNGKQIVIPVKDQEGNILFNKYRRGPNSKDPRKYTYDKGSKSALFGTEFIKKASYVVIAEGEMDTMVLLSNRIASVSSTGGAGTFNAEWLPFFEEKEVYVCYDRDAAGDEGMKRVGSILSGVKRVALPEEVGEHGDITDFFTSLKKTRADFIWLMKEAVVIIPPVKSVTVRRPHVGGGDLQKAKEVPIDTFLKVNSQSFAMCPFHPDSTASLHIFGPNRFKCFGCGKQGDVIDLVMQLNNIRMGEAIKMLLEGV